MSTRPDPAGESTKVAVGIFIIDVTEINEVKQSFVADLIISLSWLDPRLSAHALGSSLNECRFYLNEIWHPDIRIVNRRDVKIIWPEIVTVNSEGIVHYKQRVFGELSSPFNLRDFPFDAQQLPIKLISLSYGPDDVLFVVDKRYMGKGESLSLAGWTVELDEPSITTRYVRSLDKELSRFVHHLNVDRETGFFLWQVMIPLCLIVFMGWSVFWIDPSDLGPQIGISTATIFTLIAFKFSLGYLLPHVTYLTRLDKFVFGSTLLVFMALSVAITTSKMAKGNKHLLALKIDDWARYLYPTLFILLTCFSLWF